MQELLKNISHFEFEKSRITNLKSIDEADKIAVSLFTKTTLIINHIAEIYIYVSDNSKRVFIGHESVIAGLIVRLDKFLVKLLESYTERELELASILIRVIVETGINLCYFIQEGSDELYEEFKKYSYRTSIKTKSRLSNMPKGVRFKDTIEEHTVRRLKEDKLLEVDIDENSRQDWSGKGGIYKRAKETGNIEFYNSLFSHSSHAIHGNWEDLTTFHLEKNEEGYIGSYEEIRPTFDLLQGMIAFNCRMIECLNEALISNKKTQLTLKKLNKDYREKNHLLFIKTNLINLKQNTM